MSRSKDIATKVFMDFGLMDSQTFVILSIRTLDAPLLTLKNNLRELCKYRLRCIRKSAAQVSAHVTGGSKSRTLNEIN